MLFRVVYGLGLEYLESGRVFKQLYPLRGSVWFSVVLGGRSLVAFNKVWVVVT